MQPRRSTWHSTPNATSTAKQTAQSLTTFWSLMRAPCCMHAASSLPSLLEPGTAQRVSSLDLKQDKSLGLPATLPLLLTCIQHETWWLTTPVAR